MGSLFAPLLNTLGTLFSPVHLVFQYVFYQPVFNVLMLVYAGIHSFALAIVILTLLIRASLIPLTRRQLRSSKVMQELAPQLNELRAQYKDRPQEMMAAQQALYKEHGVSLYGGCLPLLVQLPFLYALYYSFFAVLDSQPHETITHHLARVNADIYPFLPHLTHLPATWFFWTSLATPDTLHILPVLAGVLTFIQLRMSLPVRAKNQPRPAGGAPDPSQSMQIMQYIMPFITVFIGMSFPAGLALYWCITTGFSAVQQYFISGWGSLFVGVPGMERFVPPPKTPTPPTTTALTRSRTTTTATPARSSLTGSSDSSPQADAPTGGFFQRLFANAAAQAAVAQKAAEEAAAARQRDIEEQRAARRAANTASNGAGANGAGANAANGANAARRARAPKAGPVLVKPPTTSATPTEASFGDAMAPAPRNAGNGAQGKTLLPEQAIIRDGVSGVSVGSTAPVATASATGRVASGVSAPKGAGANGASKANGSNGSNGANGSSKGNGANGSRGGAAKNSQPQRPRSNGAASRPKGGR